MFARSTPIRNAVAGVCAAAVVCTFALLAPAFGDDAKTMAGDGMMKKDAMPMTDSMMADGMTMMKDGMKDDAAKMQMTNDMAKMMVMQKMAMQMCTDGKCMMMMTQDEPTMKMMDAASKMAADPDKMATMRDAIMNDPASMKMVTMMSMAHSAMMKDMPASKMDGGKMDGGKMDSGKADSGKMMK